MSGRGPTLATGLGVHPADRHPACWVDVWAAPPNRHVRQARGEESEDVASLLEPDRSRLVHPDAVIPANSAEHVSEHAKRARGGSPEGRPPESATLPGVAAQRPEVRHVHPYS